jgi:poly(3-hydroxybutyrate) depolymerase
LVLTQGEPVQLVIYATPNGGTVEQAIGRAAAEGDDGSYQAQNIGAQTRWLRRLAGWKNLVVAYLEPDGKSWPAWRKANDPKDQLLPRMVDALVRHFPGKEVRVTLSGHSGGGSFTFGYVNAVAEIPAEIIRVAFLDSNYGWETKRHATKFSAWLQASADHRLTVIAYQDSVALLNGNTFVSESGGTWGRSQAMLQDLAPVSALTSVETTLTLEANSQSGQMTTWLRKNPDKIILHTVLVERNGFIHAMLSGSTQAGEGYEMMGPRAYSDAGR